MLEHHLHRLELAGLIEIQGEKMVLTEAVGVACGGMVKEQREKGGKKT